MWSRWIRLHQQRPIWMRLYFGMKKTLKKLTNKDIRKLIQDTRDKINEFNRNLKHAPSGSQKNEYKHWIHKSRIKLNKLEEIAKEGTWHLEKEY